MFWIFSLLKFSKITYFLYFYSLSETWSRIGDKLSEVLLMVCFNVFSGSRLEMFHRLKSQRDLIEYNKHE